MKVGCDISAWICSLTPAWITQDVSRPDQRRLAVQQRRGLAVAALAVGCGLLGGLYRGRYQRGSFDELIGVGRAGWGTASALAVLGGVLVPGQRARPRTVVGDTVLALLAMVGVRYTAIMERQWPRLTASSGVKITVLRAGSTGAQLVQSLVRLPAAGCRPVAFLDDDPAMRRPRIRRIPLLSDQSRLAEVAGQTAVTVLDGGRQC